MEYRTQSATEMERSGIEVHDAGSGGVRAQSATEMERSGIEVHDAGREPSAYNKLRKRKEETRT
ncbi:MAG: hypothetical protein K2P65_15025 [Lachnospiraceae bacterium]|nr:hypothetical protein [Lachnospiraceae bacterium]